MFCFSPLDFYAFKCFQMKQHQLFVFFMEQRMDDKSYKESVEAKTSHKMGISKNITKNAWKTQNTSQKDEERERKRKKGSMG